MGADKSGLEGARKLKFLVTSTEIIREQSMGFVEGLEILVKYTVNEKKVYIFYRELLNK